MNFSFPIKQNKDNSNLIFENGSFLIASVGKFLIQVYGEESFLKKIKSVVKIITLIKEI